MDHRRKMQAFDWRRWRTLLLLVGVISAGIALESRGFYLQGFKKDFLSAQGNNRHVRTVQISAHRGSITDRNGEPLGVSTPVDSIWANPQELKPAMSRLDELANILDLDEDWLARRITSNPEREFVYLRRHMRPDHATRALQAGIPGIATQREYRRYYPAGEVVGHLVGFTNIDDVGQEGLEYEFDYWLRGETGAKRVIKDRLGRVIEDVELVTPSRPGKTLRASLDLRVQYLAYRELKKAITENQAPVSYTHLTLPTICSV